MCSSWSVILGVGATVADSLCIFGQVTACLPASVCPDEEWDRLLIYEW